MKKKRIPQAKTRGINLQQTYSTQNVKGNSSNRRNIIPDRNLGLHKEIKNTEINEGKNKLCFSYF